MTQAPVRRPRARLAGIDLARLVALLGMFTAHIASPQSFSGPAAGEFLFTLSAGRASALFAVLAGVSIALASPLERARSDPRGMRGRILVRAAIIAGLGLFLGLFPSGVAVILTYYGVLFCLAVPVLTWRASRLAVLALAWGLLSPVLSVLLREQLPASSGRVASLVQLLVEPGQMLTELLVTGYYPVLTWATYLFAGMAVGRVLQEDSSDRFLRALTVGGAALAALSLGFSALVAGMPRARTALLASLDASPGSTALETYQRLGFYGTHPTETWWWLGIWVPHSGSIVDLAHTTGSAFLVLGALLWLVRVTPSPPWHVIGGAGSMTLSLYTAHVLLLASPLGAEGLLAKGTLTGLCAHSALAILVGMIVAGLGRRGPLEAMTSTVVQSRPLRHTPV